MELIILKQKTLILRVNIKLNTEKAVEIAQRKKANKNNNKIKKIKEANKNNNKLTINTLLINGKLKVLLVVLFLDLAQEIDLK